MYDFYGEFYYEKIHSIQINEVLCENVYTPTALVIKHNNMKIYTSSGKRRLILIL